MPAAQPQRRGYHAFARKNRRENRTDSPKSAHTESGPPKGGPLADFALHALTGTANAHDAGNSGAGASRAHALGGAGASRAHALGGAGTPNGAPAPPAGFAN